MEEMWSIVLFGEWQNKPKSGDDASNDVQFLLSYVNKIYGESIQIPFHLHGEKGFKGTVTSASVGVDIMLAMEEYILEEELNFKLRYVLYEGMIVEADAVAPSFQGSAVEHATQRLLEMKKDGSRFFLSSKPSIALNKIMRVTQHFIDGWGAKDRKTVSGFLQGHDYKAMAKIEQKDESTLWRRRKSLSIDEYLASKELIHHILDNG